LAFLEENGENRIQAFQEENGENRIQAFQEENGENKDTGLPRGKWREQYHLKMDEFHRTGLKALNLRRSLKIMILTSRT